MAGNNRPDWVISDLSSLLGFDAESVKQMLLPDFEGFTHQVKLKSHLQDFLGPSPAAKAFIDRYIALRFPSLANVPTSVPTPSSPSGPIKASNATAAGRSHQGSGTNTPSGLAGGGAPSAEALSAAFGPGGRIYQKNRDADDAGVGHSRMGSGSHTPAGQYGGSGRATPARSGGALSIHEAKSRGKQRADTGGVEGKGVHGSKIWDLPKSTAVLRLEGIQKELREVQAGEGKVKSDPAKACFCQGRVHPISTYTPHCPHCGLIICSLHPSHHPCPSCLSLILSPAALARLILRVQSDIDAQLALEQEERDEEERKKQEEVRAQAAFPYLAGAAKPTKFEEEGMKVLTIGGKGPKGKGKGKAVLKTTYMRPVASASGSSTPIVVEPDDIVLRPRSGLMDAVRMEKEVTKLEQWRKEEDRPWGDMKAAKKGEGLVYIPPLVIVINAEDHVGRRKAKKAKGVGMDGRAVVGAATS